MAKFEIMDQFKTILLVMAFYSLIITSVAYALPDDTLNYLTIFRNANDDINLDTINSEVRDSLNVQTDIPVIEVGSLIFYSGNILIDLIVNFAFAIPEMVGMVINGFMLLFNIDSNIFAFVELFTATVVVVMYFISIMQLLTGIRSGRVV